jgi:hypothetical protein
MYRLQVILDLDSINQWSRQVHHNIIRVVKQTDMMYIAPVRVIVGPAHLLRENATLDRIDSAWLVQHPVDLDTYRTVYLVTMPQSCCAGGR